MSILLTGAAGFIGSNLADRLIANGENVVGIDNFDDFYDPNIKRRNVSEQKKEIPFYEGDINNTELIDSIIKKESVNKIINIAARAGVRQSLLNPLIYVENNSRGTLNLLEIAKKNNIEQFILASTSSIYGGNEKIPFSESDNVDNQISPYATSKRAAELYCNNYSKLFGLPVTILRLFTVYGPRQRPEMAIHKFTRAIDNNEELTMFGDGSTSRDYTFIDDIVDGFVAALKNPFKYEIINLGDSSPVKLSELISRIENTMGKKAKIKELPEQTGDMKATFADISKAGKLLGYKPKVPIEKGIDVFVEWFKSRNQQIAISN